MELRRILNQNPTPPDVEPQRIPRKGLLTRTIARSPVVKWILPARLRREDKNDVIIVHSNHLDLQQISGRRLRNLAVKDDFDATIRAARVLGAPVKPMASPVTTESDYPDSDSEVEGIANDASSMEIDPESSNALPPHILVLAIRSGIASRLMFLYARDDRHGHIEFVSAVWSLPGHASDACRPDTHMSIDPNSLALAMGAQSDKVVLCALKPKEQLVREMKDSNRSNGEQFIPMKEQVEIPLPAIILHMEFLHPPKEKEYNGIVLLLLVLSAAGQNRVRLIEWDSTRPLREYRNIWEGGYPLPADMWQFPPSQLIPATHYCGFILMYDSYMLMYKDIHSGHSDPFKLDIFVSLPNDSPSLYEFGELSRSRHWTAWTRPVRNPGFFDTRDALYLGREDGLISFVMSNSKAEHAERHQVGGVDVNIDTGFAALDTSGSASLRESDVELDSEVAPQDSRDSLRLWSGDMLAATGNLSAGRFFIYAARCMATPLLQKLHNWSPVFDWTSVPLKGHPSPSMQYDPLAVNCGRIFACAGYGMRRGKLCEIRSGIEASCSAEISMERLDFSRPTRLWLLPGNILDPKTVSATLILSGPGGSTEIRALNSRGELDGIVQDHILDQLIDTDAETLAVSVTAHELAVQITSDSIRVIQVRSGVADRELVTHETSSKISFAYIDGRSSTLLACIGDDDFELCYYDLCQGKERLEITTAGVLSGRCLGSAVSSITLSHIMGSPVAIVGTADGYLKVYRANSKDMPLLASYQFGGDSAVCESLCCLQRKKNQAEKEDFIACGLRNGMLQVLRLEYEEAQYQQRKLIASSLSLHFANKNQGVSLVLHGELRLGYSVVWGFPEFKEITKTGSDPSSAILICQDMVFRVIVRNQKTPKLSVHRIWPSRSDSQMIPSRPIFALGQFQSWLRRHHFSNTIVYINEDAIRVMVVDPSRIAGIVPLYIRIHGTPRRVNYVASVDKLVVGYEELVMAPAQENERSSHGRQFLFSKILIIDPNGNLEPPPPEEAITVGLSGDRVTSILEWNPKLDGKQWRMLVVTTIRKQEQGSCIYIYRISEQEGECFLRLQKDIPRGGAVHAIAAFGDSCLVYGCKNRLEMIQIAPSEKGGLSWSQPTERQLDLLSPVRALTTSGNEIFVSTSMHSHLVCTVMDGQLKHQSTDSQQSDGLDNIPLEDSILAGVDSIGGVRGLWRMDGGSRERNMPLIFKTQMLQPITRLGSMNSTPNMPLLNTGIHPGFIGSSVNGSFHAFHIVDEPQWRLLRFVQNLIERQPSICPITWQGNAEKNLEPGRTEQQMHLNGDILCRLFAQRPTAAAYLQHLMEQAPVYSDRYDFPSASQRVRRFQELVQEALPENAEADPYDQLMAYLEAVLRPFG